MVKAQVNLVPNPSFEDTVPLININNINLYGTEYWFDICPAEQIEYFNLDRGTAPNTWLGYQEARTGGSFTGMLVSTDSSMVDNREYLQIQLTTPLLAGAKYLVGYYYTPSIVGSAVIITSMGFRFSMDSLLFPNGPVTTWPFQECNSIGTNTLSFVDAVSALETSLNEGGDTTSWYPLQTVYTAVGGEEFLTIGNLYNPDSTTFISTNTVFPFPINASVSYMFIDDVFVIPLEEPATYNCLAGACIDPQDGSGLYDSLATCQAACNATAIEENNTTKQLLYITDVLGRESKPTPNVPLFYRYDDGTVEKRIVVE